MTKCYTPVTFNAVVLRCCKISTSPFRHKELCGLWKSFHVYYDK